ncbi:MAG: hypothetical protein ABIQ78_03175 [Dokdonella sp.]
MRHLLLPCDIAAANKSGAAGKALFGVVHVQFLLDGGNIGIHPT